MELIQSEMALHILVFFTVFLVECSSGEEACGLQYLHLSSDHTICKSPNATCLVVKKGVSEDDRYLILQLHNEFRNKLATGKETEAGGMPEAADMLEMVWDDELAEIAQRHAETCVYEHDCDECRALGHFTVGQNIGIRMIPMSSNAREKDWNWFLTGLYEEVTNFNNTLIDSYVFNGNDPETQYGHFTQIAWSESWRVGCGWVLYKDGYYKNSYYVCNYGPAGNIQEEKLYEIGPVCSSCPKNSCCGKICEQFSVTPRYEGLCKVIDETSPPSGFGPFDFDDIFYCDFHGQTDCESIAKGKDDWKLVETINGNWISITLNGGETAWMMMTTSFESPSDDFCFNILLRSGSLTDESSSRIYGDVTFLTDGGRTLQLKLESMPERIHFTRYRMNIFMNVGAKITIILQFSTRHETTPQFIHIKEVSVKGKQCS